MREQSTDDSEDEMLDELLEQAIASVQQQEIPKGPSRQLAAATLETVHDLERPFSGTLPVAFRVRTMKLTATAAAVLVTASAAALMVLAMKSPSAAFGQAIKQLREAASMSYVQIMKVDGKDNPITTKNFIAEDGRRRTELPAAGGGVTTIFDTNGSIRLVLIEPTKTALVHEARDEHSINAGRMFVEWLQALKKLGDKPDQELGEKELDGRQVTGFIATQGRFVFTIWVDNSTGDLVRAEHDSMVNDKPTHITMTDFRFNELLDDSMFSFSAPAGYKVRQSGVPSERKAIPSGETNVIESLRGYTKRDGGKFPLSLTDWGPWAILFSKDSKDSVLDPQAERVMGHLGAVLPFLLSMPKDDYAYLGNGKTVEDKDAIVFWYKKPDGTLRAIFGDFSVKNITLEQLSEK